MVNNEEHTLSQLFSALSDPTRRAMLQRMREAPLPVAELAEPFNLSKSAITKHVKVLESAGLLQRRIDGRVHHCELNPEPLKQVSEWVNFYEQFWSRKFDSLDQFLTTTPKPKQ